MQVNQYLYQSPSASSIQVGRLDPSSQKNDSSDVSQNFSSEIKTLKEVVQDSISTTSQTIEPTITTTKMDIYA